MAYQDLEMWLLPMECDDLKSSHVLLRLMKDGDKYQQSVPADTFPLICISQGKGMHPAHPHATKPHPAHQKLGILN